MGNRAVITTKEKELALYLHWNGGRDTVEPLLRYCELKGYRPPSKDCYGWARMAQVIGNFFGGTLSLGIALYSSLGNQGDNGVYIIDGWEIVGREYPYDGFEEQQEYDFDEMLRVFDASMPEDQRLGGYLDAVEVPASKLKTGDMVYRAKYESKPETFPVVGFTDEGVPLLGIYDHDGDWSWNRNNWVMEDKVRIKPKAAEETLA